MGPAGHPRDARWNLFIPGNACEHRFRFRPAFIALVRTSIDTAKITALAPCGTSVVTVPTPGRTTAGHRSGTSWYEPFVATWPEVAGQDHQRDKRTRVHHPFHYFDGGDPTIFIRALKVVVSMAIWSLMLDVSGRSKTPDTTASVVSMRITALGFVPITRHSVADSFH